MLTILTLENNLKKSWSAQTSSPRFRKNWTPHNITAGQCAITALIVNDLFGGQIKKCYIGEDPHYFNLVSNKIIDLTRAQFGKIPIDYNNSTVKTRQELLSSPDIKHRYDLLKHNLHKIQN